MQQNASSTNLAKEKKLQDMQGSNALNSTKNKQIPNNSKNFNGGASGY